ncbi:MAG: alpha/beta fold hydrolase [Bacillus sp. (in: Bacteria)]|nr:alpha/beta fold hydrolase [Bacillus sp. (in: firmicutes)]
MYAKIRGTRLYFDVEGSSYDIVGTEVRNKPVCFVLHGGPGGTHTIYKPHLTPLTKYVQFVYIDNRGSGLSDKGPQHSYTLENNVEDVEALREYLGLEKIWLLGQSYGGMVALSYAAKYQGNLEGMLLLTTSASYRFMEDAKEKVLAIGTEEQRRMAEVLWRGEFQSMEELGEFYKVMGPLYSYSKVVAKSMPVNFPGERSYEALNEGFGRFLWDYDVRDRLRGISIPTLVIGGRHDWITPVEHSVEIGEGIPGSKLVIFENSSHSIMRDEPEKFLNVVSKFLQENI